MGVISLDLQQTDAGGGIEEEIRRLEQAIDAEEDARISGDADVSQAVADEREARQDADTEIWQEINTIEASSDVVDVVGTYQDLVSYDTSKLHVNDLIKVLQDITHGNAITYYRWDGTSYNYVGAEGPYYTTSETDALLNSKQNNIIAGNNISIAADGKTISAVDTTYTAGTNISISPQNVISATFASYSAGYGLTLDQNNIFAVDLSLIPIISDIPTKTSDLTNDGSDGTSTYVENDDLTTALAAKQDTIVAGTNIQIAADGKTISATDTTYSDFTGATASADGVQGLVPGPLAGDQDKYLKADGTWSTVQSSSSDTLVLYADYNFHSLPTTPNTVLQNPVSFYSDEALTTLITPNDILMMGLEPGAVLSVLVKRSFSTNADYYQASLEVNDDRGWAELTMLDCKGNTLFYLSGYTEGQSFTSGQRIVIQHELTAGSNISISGTTISATDTTYAPFDGATSSASGTQGLVPAPASGDEDKYLKGDGTWGTVVPGSTMAAYYTNQYFFDSTASNFSIYTDSSMTDAITGDDLFSAFRDGPVQIIVNVNFGDPDHFYFQLVSCTPDGDDIGSDYRFTAVGMNVMIDGSFKEIVAYEFEGQNNSTAFTSQSMFIPQAAIGSFTGATSSTAGSAGLVPAPAAGDEGKFLQGDGTWATVQSGSTYTAGTGIDITNSEISVDTAVVATQTDLGNYVTLDTNQNITGEKTFVGNKRIKFKGTASNSKCGFTSFDQNNGETGFLEVEGTSTGSKKVRLGCYDQAGGNARDNYVGFQYHNTKPGGGGSTVSYNLVCPPRYRGVSGTNSYAYVPLDFTDGNTTIRADNTGVLNLSTLLPSYSDFTGATSSTAGAHGLVPAPAAGDEDRFLAGDGTWKTAGGSNKITIIATDMLAQLPAIQDTSVPQSYQNLMFMGQAGDTLAFATGDALHMLSAGDIAGFIADGYDVDVIGIFQQFDGYQQMQTPKVTGKVLATSPYAINDPIVFSFMSENLRNTLGLFSVWVNQKPDGSHPIYQVGKAE